MSNTQPSEHNGLLLRDSGMNPEGLNGDQFFTATFSTSGGAEEFPSFNTKQEQKGVNNSNQAPSKNMIASGDSTVHNYARAVAGNGPENSLVHPPAHSGVAGDGSFTHHLASLSLTSAQPAVMHASLQNDHKGINVGASEFVPKTTGNQSGLGMTHSSSTPSFGTLHQPHVGSMGSAMIPAFGNLSAGTSPIASPRLSPQSSPLLQRRQHHNIASDQHHNIGTETPPPVLPVPPIGTNNLGTETPPLHIDMTNSMQEDMVGGTTYFYTQDEMQARSQGNNTVLPNFTVYPGMLPHMAHMKAKANQPSFFMPDDLKSEMLSRQVVSLAQVDYEQNADIPQEIDNYRQVVPLEPTPLAPQQKSSTFGYPTSVYKAINKTDGKVYCLRRIHGFRLANTKCMTVIDLWKKIQQSNLVQLREVFTTKAFGGNSMVFVYDYHPCSDTLMNRHFMNNPHTQVNGNGYSGPYNSMNPNSRSFTPGKGGTSGLLPENLIWFYVVQLSAALRSIHNNGLACRVLDPTKVLLTDKSRIRVNCVGIFDVLSFDANQQNPLAMMPHYQQEDLMSLGKVVLALACNSVGGIQRELLSSSMDIVTQNYSGDLKNLIMYLLNNTNRTRSVNDIMPMIGARFYTQLDAAQIRNDVLEHELSRELECGRLFRLLSKLNIINDRPEFNNDPSWSETGDRYMLKLFRDYLFHQVDPNGAPWIDVSHIVQCLNKMDAASPEKICLMSRDEQNVLVVSYKELHDCFSAAFAEILESSTSSQTLLIQQQQADANVPTEY